MIQTEKKLGDRKVVDGFRSEVINNQGIAVQDRIKKRIFIKAVLPVIIITEGVFFESFDQFEGGQIEDRMGRFQKLIGDTVGQKAFAHAGFTVNKEVRKPGIEMLNVLLAPCRDRPHILRRADAEAGIYGL